MTVVNYPGGHHAFEMVDDEAGDAGRHRHHAGVRRAGTSPAYQASLRRGLPEATAAAHVAAATSRPRRRSMPISSRRSRTTRGCGCRTAKRSSARSRSPTACSVFDQLKGKGLGAARPRPAGRARVHAEGRSGGGDGLAGVDPGALSCRRRSRASPSSPRSANAPTSRRCSRGGTLSGAPGGVATAGRRRSRRRCPWRASSRSP